MVSQDLSVRWVSDGYPILHSTPSYVPSEDWCSGYSIGKEYHLQVCQFMLIIFVSFIIQWYHWKTQPNDLKLLK